MNATGALVSSGTASTQAVTQSRGRSHDGDWRAQCARLTQVETATYLRDKTAIFWTFLYPVILLMIMMTLFGNTTATPSGFQLSIDIEGQGEAAEVFSERIEQNLGYIEGVSSEVRRVDPATPTESGTVRLVMPDASLDDVSDPVTVHVALDGTPDADSGSVLALIAQTATELNMELAEAPEFYRMSYAIEPGSEAAMSESVYYVVGLAVLTIVSTALFGFSAPLIDLRARGGLKLFQVMPVHRTAFLAAFGLCRVLILFCFVLLFIVGGLAIFGGLGDVTTRGWGLLALLTLAGSVSFLAAGLAIAGLVTNNTLGSALINVINLPIIFLSDLFIPLSTMPGPIQDFSRALPVYLLVDAMRGAAQGTFTISEAGPVFASLGILFAISMVIVSTTFRWRLKR